MVIIAVAEQLFAIRILLFQYLRPPGYLAQGYAIGGSNFALGQPLVQILHQIDAGPARILFYSILHIVNGSVLQIIYHPVKSQLIVQE
jgi:hypothetical protein